MPRHRPQLDLSCSSGPREGPGERAVRGGSWGALRALGLEQVGCVCVLAVCPTLFATPWTVARQAPLSMEYSRQECWSGLPFPPPGDLRHRGIKPESPVSPALACRFLTTALPGKLLLLYNNNLFLHVNQNLSSQSIQDFLSLSTDL